MRKVSRVLFGESRMITWGSAESLKLCEKKDVVIQIQVGPQSYATEPESSSPIPSLTRVELGQVSQVKQDEQRGKNTGKVELNK